MTLVETLPERRARLVSARPPAEPGHLRCLLLLFAWSLVLFFHGLDQGELYRTESLRALLASGFLQSGNWVVPELYGEPLLTKPPGMYAGIALASWPTGRVTATTARLPSALAATAVVLLIYWAFARRLGRLAGLVAALIAPASFLWLDKAPSAEIDMVQVAWVTAAMVFLLRALDAEEASRGRQPPVGMSRKTPRVRAPGSPLCWWVAALLCVAGGFLTKWTAPVFFYLTAVPLLWWRGRLRLLWSRYHLCGATLAAAIGLTWVAAAIHQAGWSAFVGAIRQEALPRFSPAEHGRPYPWGEVFTHPLSLVAGSLPWSACALLTLVPGFTSNWDKPRRRLLQALHCWTWPSLLFWSVVPGHHVRHTLPLVPGLAGLAALVWIAWLEGPHRRLARRGLFGLLLVWLLIKWSFVASIVPLRDAGRWPRSKGEALARLVPEGHMLYLTRAKDEGILFYYGREARRLPDLVQVPTSGQAVYCLLVASEWQSWPSSRPAQLLLTFHDEQGDPLLLVKTW